MITITDIRNVNYAAYDEVWAIVRSLKNPGRMKHVPELSPSWALFKKYLQLRDTGKWNADAFRSIYVPTFLKEMSGIELKRKLSELIELDRQGKRICMICFCHDETLCHRSIIAGILQYMGVQVQNVKGDYSKYGSRGKIMNAIIEKMRNDGYPYKIKGNGGYTAVLYDMQPLGGGDYMAIYRYPGGECCHGLSEIQMCCEVIEQ